MSEAAPGDSSRARAITAVVYALHALTLVFGFPILLALALNLATRNQLRGTVYESHCAWQLVTAQWALIPGIPGFVLFSLGPAAHDAFLPLGSLLLVITSFWIIYRTIRGFLLWSHRQAAPVPRRTVNEE